MFDERGINEPTTDDNIQMTSSITSQELTNVGKKTMDDTDPAIESSKMVVEQTVEVGRQSSSTWDGQPLFFFESNPGLKISREKSSVIDINCDSSKASRWTMLVGCNVGMA
ncbi:putative plant SNARE 12, partial [Cucurbita argyrosperma subsp. argyrosperma]